MITTTRPLFDYSDKELKKAVRESGPKPYSVQDFLAELTHRQQRRLSIWVAIFIAGTLTVSVANLIISVCN